MSSVYGQTLLDDMVRTQSLPMPLVREAAREILAIIREGLVRQGVVNVSNFGTFRLKPVAERNGVNPQTREPITIPAHQRVIFSPCKALRELIQPQHTKPLPIPKASTGRAAARSVALAGGAAVATKRIVPPPPQAATEESLTATPLADAITTEAVAAPPLEETQKLEDTTAWAEYPEATAETATHPGEEKGGELSLELGSGHKIEGTGPASKRHYYLGATALLVIAVVTASLLHGPASEEPPAPPQSTVTTTAQPTPTVTDGTEFIAKVTPTTPTQAAVETAPPAEEVDYSTLYTEMAEATPQETSVATDRPIAMDKSAATSRGESSGFYFSEQPHTLSEGDSLWRLARSHYHDPLLWPHIYQANAAHIDDPDRLRTGRQIVIPTLQGTPDRLTKTDRRNIAEGYYLTYLHYRESGHPDAFFALLEAKRYDNRVVEEHRSLLQLSKVEELMLSHQRTMPF